MKDELKDRLKYAMRYKNMKAVDLCEKTGIPKSAVSYYLSGRSTPKSDRLYIIAKCLDVSEAWLLGYDVAMDRSSEQKETDALADMYNRIKKEKEFRNIILRINALNSQQLDVIKNLLDAFPSDQQ